MTLQAKVYLALGLYALLFMATLLGVVVWKAKRRKEKPPLEFKLLRGAGESLRRRLAKFDEDLASNALFVMAAPVLVGLTVGGAFLKFLKPADVTQFWLMGGLTALAFVVALIFSIRLCMRSLGRYRNDRLGYLGERAVGEALEPLSALGYRVFHDVPAEIAGKKFNVDHVVIGQNGIFALETKTRRKGRVRPGFEAHKVIYDGKQLIWPWAEDSFGLQQAEGRARWLSEWINKMTGISVAAKPLLVLPGWYVVPKALGTVSVLNHKQLVGAITRSPAGVLAPDQVDLIARQLDNLCRDVED